MLKDARNYLALAPWLAVYPGLAVFLTVLAATVLGNELSRFLATKETQL
jgi:peptide/nickel transport system permease protein